MERFALTNGDRELIKMALEVLEKILTMAYTITQLVAQFVAKTEI